MFEAFRKSATVLAVGFVSTALVAIGANSTAHAGPAPVADELGSATVADSPTFKTRTRPDPVIPDSPTNRALESLARKLAVAATSAEVRQTLHDAIQRRFDGDTNVLWSSLAGNSDFNRTVAVAAGRGQATAEAAQQLARTALVLPRLQIAVPKTFDSWDSRDYVPLVTFVPEGVDDTELNTFTAYDSRGNTVLLDAAVTPENPVLVVSLNERTDENGKLRSKELDAKATETTETMALAAAATRYQVGMVIVHLIHDMEPWAKGDAEIAHAARTRGCSGVNYEDYNWANLNNDDDWWAPGTRRVLGSTTCPVVFAWWEDDGGAWNFELKYGDFGFGIGMDDDDDQIGKVQLPYSSFKGASMAKYGGWSNLHMWTD